jgi:hypothetical protein
LTCPRLLTENSLQPPVLASKLKAPHGT